MYLLHMGMEPVQPIQDVNAFAYKISKHDVSVCMYIIVILMKVLLQSCCIKSRCSHQKILLNAEVNINHT